MKKHLYILFLMIPVTIYGQYDFGYPVPPDLTDSDPSKPVGSTGGAFDVSATGAATYAFPIATPPGGMQPQLALSYNSQSGNGIAGWGFHIAGISAITRAPKNIYHDHVAMGMTYDKDEAYMLDGKRLIFMGTGSPGMEGAVYSIEGDPYTRVTAYGDYSPPDCKIWFEVVTREGIKYTYGKSNGKQTYRAYLPSLDRNMYKVNAWYLERTDDLLGNYTAYSYERATLYTYLKTVTYGNKLVTNHVDLVYEARSDQTPFRLENQPGSMGRRLKTITTRTGNSKYREYTLTYGGHSDDLFSRLGQITEKNGQGEAMKPVSFTWSPLIIPNYKCNDTKMADAEVPHADQMYTAGDFTGDGIDDIIGMFYMRFPDGSDTNYANVYRGSVDQDGRVSFHYYEYFDIGPQFNRNGWKAQKGGSFPIDFDGDGMNELIIPHFSDRGFVSFQFKGNNKMNDRDFKYTLRFSDEIPLYATGDFNNDGKGDVVLLEKGGNGNHYPGYVVFHEKEGQNLVTPALYLNLPQKPGKLFSGDFNGDGMLDIIFIHDGGYTIYWNKNGVTSIFSDYYKYEGTAFKNDWMIRPGDFNGDGLPDFILNATGSRYWYFALNKGDGTFERRLACTLDVYDQNFTSHDDDKFECHVYDFDPDGKSDVIITKAMYERKTGWGKEWGSFTEGYTYWMRSTGQALEQFKSVKVNVEEYLQSRFFVTGDFDGDGRIDLINYGPNCYNHDVPYDLTCRWRIYRDLWRSESTGMITGVTDGFGNKTDIRYVPLTNTRYYKKGEASQYPLVDITPPLPAVKEVRTTTDDVITSKTGYQYAGARAHLKGKGFLGLTSVKAQESVTGITTETGTVKLNTTYFLPEETYTRTTVDGTTAGSVTAFSIHPRDRKQYFMYPARQTDTDPDGFVTVTARDFDISTGNLEKETVTYGENMYRTVKYSDFTEAGGILKTKPRKVVSISRHPHDDRESVSRSTFGYDPVKGYLTRKTENDSTYAAVTTAYSYNGHGNLIASTVSANGILPVTSHLEYDPTGRFVTREYTTPQSSISSYEYDVWGRLLKANDETTGTTLTTTHEYDNWGRRTWTVFPDGRREKYDTGWGAGAGQCYFSVVQSTAAPWVKTWYDAAGRETSVETVGPAGVPVSTRNTYNEKGQLEKTTSTQGDLVTSTDYTYDGRGRISSETGSSGQETDYTYRPRMVFRNINQQLYGKTYDAWGGVVTSLDPGGTVSYRYNSMGKPHTITTRDISFSMKYDDVGNRTELVDPNAGTITSTYDALGRILTRKDGKGQLQEYAYDALGRVSESILTGTDKKTLVTTCSYVPSGNGKLQLEKQQTGDSFISYTYDPYGRIKTEKRNPGGDDLTFVYAYDGNGNLESVGYPGNLSVIRQYDAYGNLEKVTAGTQVIWEMKGHTGTSVTTRLGGSMTTTTRYSTEGLLSSVRTVRGDAVVHSMDYRFNGITGNLDGRSGMYDHEEIFTHDDMYRLTGIQKGADPLTTVEYAPNGNITRKTGLGGYTYGDKPHAVKTVDNTGGLISPNKRLITYTAFHKTASVSEKVGNDDYLLSIGYGTDRQRSESVLKKNGSIIRTTVFAGDFEQVTEGAVTTQFYYLSGADGLAAVYVRQSGQPDAISYVHTDHLGSIVKLTDAAGNTVFKAAYDAWGVQDKDKSNTFAFHRGYTGHEQLPEFNLINMNGRMYDPVLSRFLSPDPFVQAPDFTQSFNRYSYCMNNPLVYTDPSGYWAGWDDLLVGGIGFLTGYLSYGLSNKDWGLNAIGSGILSAGMFMMSYYSGPASAGSIANAYSNAGLQSHANTVGLGFSGRMVASSAISSILPSASINIDNATLSVSPAFMIGSGGYSVGLNFQASYYAGDFTFGGALGTSYGKSGFTGITGSEIRLSGFAGYDDGTFGIGLSSTQFWSGETSQRLGRLSMRYDDFSMSYENDGTPFQYLGFAGGTDSYRTASATLGYKDFTIGMLLFTGHRDYNAVDYSDPENYPYGMVSNPEINKYNAGILYAGYGNMRAGWNHDNIRHVFQNRGAHGGYPTKQAWIPRKNWPNQPYFVYGANNPYTNW